MMRKKFFAGIFLGVMLLALAGCKGDGDNKETTPIPKQEKEEDVRMTSTPEPTVTSEPTVAPEPTVTPEPAVTLEPTVTPEPTVMPSPTEEPEKPEEPEKLWLETVPLEEAEVGKVVLFGAYEQDSKKANGKEPIEWMVLAEEHGRVLLLSKYGLDSKKYHEVQEDITWETCSLRYWLNDYFYENSFTEEEKEKIPVVNLKNHAEYDSGVTGGKDTKDRVFLLSAEQVETLFPKYRVSEGEVYTGSDIHYKYRTTTLTAYAFDEGKRSGSMNTWEDNRDEWYVGNCYWWLRTPGNYQELACIVRSYGEVDDRASTVDENLAVRPAIWVTVDPNAAVTKKEDSVKVSEPETAKKGDIVEFGRYEQDTDITGEVEAIRWIVLDVKNGSALLLSKDVLEGNGYQISEGVYGSNATYPLMNHLNEKFYESAFYTWEKNCIMPVDIQVGDSEMKKCNVFLLSISEVKKYLSEKDLIAYPSESAKESGIYIMGEGFGDSTGAVDWWLRQDGEYDDWAPYCSSLGRVDDEQDELTYEKEGVRPAVWVNLSEIANANRVPDEDPGPKVMPAPEVNNVKESDIHYMEQPGEFALKFKYSKSRPEFMFISPSGVKYTEDDVEEGVFTVTNEGSYVTFRFYNAEAGQWRLWCDKKNNESLQFGEVQ